MGWNKQLTSTTAILVYAIAGVVLIKYRVDNDLWPFEEDMRR